MTARPAGRCASAGALVAALLVPCAVAVADEVPIWEKVAQPGPEGRRGPGMVFDVARSTVVLFGGGGLGDALGDTWEWNGNAWTLRAIAGPPGRSGPAMAYDTDRRVTVLVGGQANNLSGSANLGDTWEYNGLTWSERPAGARPPARRNAAMAYDRARKVMVLFGGRTSLNAPLDDTWEWDGSTWTRRNVTGPSARAEHAMSYDPVRGVTVLYGGAVDSQLGPSLNETWEWDGAQWSRRGGGPPPLQSPTMTYDADRRRVVIYGGNDRPQHPIGALWEWNGTTWTERVVNGPIPSVRRTVMAYDAVRHEAVVFGGDGGSPGLFSDTWTLDGTGWKRRTASSPTVRLGPAAYDSDRGVTVFFGEFFDSAQNLQNEIWEWDGSSWRAVPLRGPVARQMSAMAYDAARQQTVLFGGVPFTTRPGFRDTWTWNGTDWRQAATTGPPVRWMHQLTYDAARRVVFMFGGYSDQRGDLNDTWVWNGAAWTQMAINGPSPPARQNSSLAFDARRNVVVLFGGTTDGSTTRFGDTWEWDGATWTQRQVSGPAPRSHHQLAWDAARGVTVLIGGFDLSPPPLPALKLFGDTWEWNGTTWTERTTALPGKRSHFAMAFDAARSRVVLTGGQAGAPDEKPSFETWTYHTRGGACTAAAACNTGSCVDGVCCERAACGTCEACNGAGSPGLCSILAGRTDPDSCTGTRTCTATGACKLVPGNACVAPEDCASGFCADSYCCDVACDGGGCSACNGGDLAWPGATNGTCANAPVGTSGDPSCSPYLCNGGAACPSTCTATSNCIAHYFCDRTNKCTRHAPGESCVTAEDCDLMRATVCVDGVCCTSPCDGRCQRCDLPGSAGTCASPVGEDPDGDCPGEGACHGACAADGACRYPGNDTPCDTCKACNQSGRCNQLPASGDDAACGTVACGALSTACRTFGDISRARCVGIGLCAAPNDPATCTQSEAAADGTPCPGGQCAGGRCAVAAVDAGAGSDGGGPIGGDVDGGGVPETPRRGCSLAPGAAPPSTPLALLALATLLAVRRRRPRRRAPGRPPAA